MSGRKLQPRGPTNNGGYRTFFRTRKGGPWHLEHLDTDRSICGSAEFTLNAEGLRVYGHRNLANYLRRKSVCKRCREAWKRRAQ